MTLPMSVQPCESGRHGSHTVTLLDELTATCAPACEAATFRPGTPCRHITQARAEFAARAEAVPSGAALPAAGSRLLRHYDLGEDDTAGYHAGHMDLVASRAEAAAFRARGAR